MATEATGESFADVSLNPAEKTAEPDVAAPPSASHVTEVSSQSPPVAEQKPEEYGVYKYYNNKRQEFYSSQEGAFEKAVEDIKEKVINKEVDGEDILGVWLLVEVDHWDNETEKVVVLTSESLLTVRYDFVPRRVHKFKRRLLKSFDTIRAGDFEYPSLSLLQHLTGELKKRTCSGVRLLWNKGVEPGLMRNWNPASDAMPWQTFTFHPLAFAEQGEGKDIYNVQHFAVAAVEAAKKAYSKHHPDQSVSVEAGPLMQQVYFGFPSQIHNQSFLGMSKDRGFLSF